MKNYTIKIFLTILVRHTLIHCYGLFLAFVGNLGLQCGRNKTEHFE